MQITNFMNIKKSPFLLTALAVLLVTACGQTFEPGSPEAVVQSLYKASAKTGMPKDQETLSQYFDGRLAELLFKDFSCFSNSMPCGLLYFDPVAQSKEPDITDLKIFKPENENEV